MNKQGIHQEKNLRIFKKLYSKSTAKVKTERTGPSFKLGSGVIYDDIVLFSPDPKNLQEILLKLDDHSKSVRLSINRNKTKIMSNWR
jgi:Reverse transcriptase (RNA-dependent DNA polymerase).